VKLVNPYFIRQLPGRKSDLKDAHWIAVVLQKELITDSFVPGPEIQQIRSIIDADLPLLETYYRRSKP
jgi:hypothetical protein